ncbi:MAG: peptidase S41 [Crocinitomicaceae bacterium]|nr:peptidase S41 [Crocinitomicaceae bacterium]
MRHFVFLIKNSQLMNKLNFQAIVLFFLAVFFVLISSFSTNRQNNNDDYFEITKNLKILASIYERVNNYYVDQPLPGELMKNAIDAMLKSLDPYTVYIPESNIEDFRLMTTGQYGGIGASIIKQGDYVVVAEPYENSPAHLAQIKAGDTILEVDGMSVYGKSIEEISQMLKGSADSPVAIKTTRFLKIKDVEVIRKKINIPSVPYYKELKNKVGYIKLNSFTEKASSDVKKALDELNTRNIEKLILDLRGNGGGLLIQAVDIVNFFIPKDELVVQTKGRMQEINRAYKTRNNPVDLNIPLVVLIDSYSASASEIVSGCIQDLDRGVIVGENSFGKGLVQQTKELKFGSKIKLTVAKYYTPSGRCIQKLDYSNKSSLGTADEIPDSLIKNYYTKNGREVKDARGVFPDIKIEPNYFSKLSETLIYNDFIFNYVNQLSVDSFVIDSPNEFTLSDKDYEKFKNTLIGKKIEYSNDSEQLLSQLIVATKQEKYYQSNQEALEQLKEKFKPNLIEDLERNKQEIKQMLEIEIVSRTHFQKGRIEASLKGDPYIEEAVSVLLDSTRYQKILNK